jgi:pantetheine-phosphate adenylyltransferase
MNGALYPGTFDPFTFGHLDVVRRALRIFDRLIILVAANPSKAPMFTIEERLEMAREVISDNAHVQIQGFDGLLVDAARALDVKTIIRGLRAMTDFEYEFEMALMNRGLDSDFESVFLMPSQEYIFLRSSLVKEVATLGGDVSALVPTVVAQRLYAKLGIPSAGSGT